MNLLQQDRKFSLLLQPQSEDSFENTLWRGIRRKKYSGIVYGESWLCSCKQIEYACFLNDRKFSGIRADGMEVLSYVVDVDEAEEYTYTGLFDKDYAKFLSLCDIDEDLFAEHGGSPKQFFMHYYHSDHCITLNCLVVVMFKYLRAMGASPCLPAQAIRHIGKKANEAPRDVRLRSFIMSSATSVGVLYGDGYIESYPKPTRDGSPRTDEEWKTYTSLSNPRFVDSAPFEYSHTMVEFSFGDSLADSIFIDLLPLSMKSTHKFRQRDRSTTMVYRMMRAKLTGPVFQKDNVGPQGSMFMNVEMTSLGGNDIIPEYRAINISNHSVPPTGLLCEPESVIQNGNALLETMCKTIPQVQCTSCGQRDGRFRCSRCGKVVYCSKECQKRDWKKNHKKVCNSKQGRTP